MLLFSLLLMFPIGGYNYLLLPLLEENIATLPMHVLALIVMAHCHGLQGFAHIHTRAHTLTQTFTLAHVST